MTFRLPSILPLFAAGILFLAPEPGYAQTVEPTPTLSLSGTGRVLAEPDMATIRAGVITQAATAKEALDENTARMTSVIQAFKDAGIPDMDLSTQNFSIQPEYRYDRSNNGVQKPPQIVSYRVENTAVVIVRDLDSLGGVLDTSVQVGANTISGPIFDVAEKGPLLDAARADAAEDALSKAEIYAETLGFELGPVMSISEGAIVRPQPKAMMMARAEMAIAADSPPVPIEGGEVGLSVTVQVTWEIEQE